MQVLPEQEYLDALADDLEQELKETNERRPLSSIFIGGGTPSLCSAAFYDGLFKIIGNKLSIVADAEITLEANPGTVDQANFSGFRQSGINRLSIGVQSFNNVSLEALGRIHNSDDAVRAFNKAREANFTNINLDLMHGLQGQSVEDGLLDLHKAISLAPEHISWYQLTIEPNTRFYTQRPVLPNDDTLSELFNEGMKTLNVAGYLQYEVSAYSKPNLYSAHNLNYWLFGDYIGLGAGAHGKLTSNKKISRRWKTRSPKDYLDKKDKLGGVSDVSRNELPLEFMMNALRLKHGFDNNIFSERTGLPLSIIQDQLAKLEANGLIYHRNQKIKPTEKGFLFLNELIEQFVDLTN